MKRFWLLFIFCYLHGAMLLAQNVGIGTTTPAFPLSFPSTLGNKIGLWGNSGNHYGLGVQSGLLQLYSDQSISNIAFGHGASTNFTERMRIINSGLDGMQLNGRIVLRNGTSPINLAAGPGVWLSRPDNSSLGGFMGVQNNTNIGFYGTGTGWGFVYNVDNGRVGLGTATPVNRLDVAGINNWDLTNTEGDMRIGNDNVRLKFGVALAGGGAGASAIMQSGGVGVLNLGANSKNIMQLNGSNNSVDLFNISGGLRIDGNAGAPKQVLQSNGGNSAPSWATQPYMLFYKVPDGQTATRLEGSATVVNVPTLHNQLIELPVNSRVQFTLCATILPPALSSSCSASFRVFLRNAANNAPIFFLDAQGYAANGDPTTIQASNMYDLAAGVYRMEVTHWRDPSINAGPSLQYGQRVIIHVFPN